MPEHEHEKKDTLHEDFFYPDRDHARTESPTFRHTKAAGHKEGIPCAISGQTENVQYHHVFCEWALSPAVDWSIVKGVALDEITELPVLDPVTDQPTSKTYPAKHSLIYAICKLAEFRGFNWHAFDPNNPETFVDSMANMLVLSEKFHIGKQHGIHFTDFAQWIFQAFPRMSGFVFTPDEVSP
jgi:hypothetical protein